MRGLTGHPGETTTPTEPGSVAPNAAQDAMPLIFFSGGLDSTTLAFDVASRPYRYGITTDTPLHLVTYTSPGKAKEKTKALAPLVHALRPRSKFHLHTRVLECDLAPFANSSVRNGGMQTLSPMLGYDPDQSAMPYTPGLHTWLAAWAINILAQYENADGQPYTSEQALFGFQWDGPVWADGEENHTCDTSLAFVESLNKMTSETDHEVWFRAPFMESRLDRGMVVQLGIELDIPFHLTSSCIQGWKVDCGVCAQCMNRQRAFKAYGVKT